jgi:hypothetical protein
MLGVAVVMVFEPPMRPRTNPELTSDALALEQSQFPNDR